MVRAGSFECVEIQRNPGRKYWWLVVLVPLLTMGFGLYAVSERAARASAFLDGKPQDTAWERPSYIYAESPVLKTGTRILKDRLVQYLTQAGYHIADHQTVRHPEEYCVTATGILFRPRNSSDQVFARFNKAGTVTLEDASSKAQIDELPLDPIQLRRVFSSSWDRQTAVPLQRIPPHLIHAVISVEDRRFYEHFGVDWRGVARAAWVNLLTGSPLQGGSTITQQYVRNRYLTRVKSWNRKIREAFLAMAVEERLSKGKILDRYLNEVYLGQDGAMSIRGVAAACRFYFNKDISTINFQEAALLAGIIQAPRKFDPRHHPQQAIQRRNVVLSVMEKNGFITDWQYQKYRKSPMVIHIQTPEPSLAPYFSDLVIRQAEQLVGKQKVERGQVSIQTTLDAHMQEIAQGVLVAGLQRIDKRLYNKTHKYVQGCLIAVDPVTGYVKAYVGGRDYKSSQFDRISQSVRQPGSAFKPFVYAAAIESAFTSPSAAFSPATILEDTPPGLEYQNVAYQPQNYNNVYYGTVTARDALAHSMNAATMQLASQVGLQNIVSLARSFGFNNVQAYPSVPLGTVEETPLSLVQAYTAFANGGNRIDLTTIQKITDASGKIIEIPAPSGKQVLHPETAYIITDMLKSVILSGTGVRARSLGLTRPIAGKTGTSDTYRDAWFIGYTPDLICLVWVGYDDNTSLAMPASDAALPIWTEFMKNSLQNVKEKDFERPPGVIVRTIDPQTGKLAIDSCPEQRQELFVEGTEPTEPCSDLDHAAYPQQLWQAGNRIESNNPDQTSNNDPDFIYFPAPQKR